MLVARGELVNPDSAHDSAQTMCKFRAAAETIRSANADQPDEIGFLYNQTHGE